MAEEAVDYTGLSSGSGRRTPVWWIEANAELLPEIEDVLSKLREALAFGLPSRVHPEFREPIWSAYCQSLKLPVPRNHHRLRERRREQWLRACGKA